MLNVVVKKEKEGQHLEAPEFFESPSSNAQEQQPQQQQQQLVVVVVNVVLFVSSCPNCASCQVFPFAEKLRLFFAQPIGEKN